MEKYINKIKVLTSAAMLFGLPGKNVEDSVS